MLTTHFVHESDVPILFVDELTVSELVRVVLLDPLLGCVGLVRSVTPILVA